MKLFAVVGTAGLAVLLSISMPVCAQDESHPQEEKRAEPDGKEARQPDRQDDKRVEQDRDKDKKQDERADHQADQNRNDRDNKHADQQMRQDDRHEQPVQDQRGGRIPEDRFRSNFGRQHTFSIGQPVIVSGTPRFQYGGYWFVISQPWPVGWAYTDAVYVDYIDGEYFLLSPVHPGVQIAINVIL